MKKKWTFSRVWGMDNSGNSGLDWVVVLAAVLFYYIFFPADVPGCRRNPFAKKGRLSFMCSDFSQYQSLSALQEVRKTS